MLISLCTPCMGRTHDLKEVMPSRIEAAKNSPPVEIVVVNYNSQDGLDDYLDSLVMPSGVQLTVRHYYGREHWHMAHGFNLAVLASSGEYFWLMGCDLFLSKNSISSIRELIQLRNNPWMMSPEHSGMIVCRKDIFVDAGGYDERFEFYGQEGLELNDRLRRRGHEPGYFPTNLIEVLPTSNIDKVKNYRIKGNKTTLSRMMRPIYEQCKQEQVLTANIGKDWGSWT